MVSFKGAHFVKDIILTCVRWYMAYPLSYRQVEELMQERGVSVDHATINRWVLKYSPQLDQAFHRRKRPVWVSWRMDETYIRVKGAWYYLYRAHARRKRRIGASRAGGCAWSTSTAVSSAVASSTTPAACERPVSAIVSWKSAVRCITFACV
jgi:hypothetical protein